MATPYLSLLSLLLLLSLSFLIQLSSSATIRCHSDEREILLQIKKSFNNPYFLASWDPTNQIDCCKWYALKCDPTKKNHITQLNIFDTTDVSGQIPANISQLSYLEQIDFNRLPNLTGPIPSSIGNLKSLTFLRLGSNQISGSIPSTLGQLSSLTFLDLSGNQLSGSIPPNLGNLTNLNALYLAINQLSGLIPASLGNLTNLNALYLAINLKLGGNCECSGMEVMKHSSHFLLQSLPPENPNRSYGLIVLNQNLPRFTPLLWKHAHLRVCADGGANRIYDEMPKLLSNEDPSVVRSRYKPDVIKGDLDSIRTDVEKFYSKLGTKILNESHDQDTTDLHKCVTFIQDNTPDLEKSNLNILVAGALGGRFDHEIGNINVLYRFSNIQIILLSDDCLIYLLPKTHRHEIHIQTSVEGPHCGLIPIGMPSASTTTTGLQWDLIETEMRFGGLISTSNIVREDKVTVQSDSDLLWTISIRKPT